MTNSDESGGSSEEETNENNLPTEPTDSWVSKTRSLAVEEEIVKDNILQLPQDLANVSCSEDLMLYFCPVQTIRDGRLTLILHSAPNVMIVSRDKELM